MFKYLFKYIEIDHESEKTNHNNVFFSLSHNCLAEGIKEALDRDDDSTPQEHK